MYLCILIEQNKYLVEDLLALLLILSISNETQSCTSWGRAGSNKCHASIKLIFLLSVAGLVMYPYQINISAQCCVTSDHSVTPCTCVYRIEHVHVIIPSSI